MAYIRIIKLETQIHPTPAITHSFSGRIPNPHLYIFYRKKTNIPKIIYILKTIKKNLSWYFQIEFKF